MNDDEEELGAGGIVNVNARTAAEPLTPLHLALTGEQKYISSSSSTSQQRQTPPNSFVRWLLAHNARIDATDPVRGFVLPFVLRKSKQSKLN